jgi:histidinol-phosphate aminotransferase
MSAASKVIRPEIQAMQAYQVTDATGLVKLDVMESPYRLPEPLAAEIGQIVSKVAMNRYPVPAANELRAVIREVMQVPKGCDVLLGNGSDECIQYITAAVSRDGAVVMAPSPSFAMVSMKLLFRLRFVGLPCARTSRSTRRRSLPRWRKSSRRWSGSRIRTTPPETRFQRAMSSASSARRRAWW